jgi:hypothetical protein
MPTAAPVSRPAPNSERVLAGRPKEGMIPRLLGINATATTTRAAVAATSGMSCRPLADPRLSDPLRERAGYREHQSFHISTLRPTRWVHLRQPGLRSMMDENTYALAARGDRANRVSVVGDRGCTCIQPSPNLSALARGGVGHCSACRVRFGMVRHADATSAMASPARVDVWSAPRSGSDLNYGWLQHPARLKKGAQRGRCAVGRRHRNG